MASGMTSPNIICAHEICAETFQSRPQIPQAVSGNPDNDNISGPKAIRKPTIHLF